MFESSHATTLDVLEYLGEIGRDDVDPPTACERLTALRSRHPQAHIELIWEEQGFDGSLHYDALIRPAGGATISLGVCPDRALPWPLRGVQKSRDSDLLRVNGTTLSVADAVARLDVLWQNGALMQRMVDACLIEEALRAHTIEVGPEEVQAALDAVRRGRGLYSVEQTRAWMKATGASEETLRQIALGAARTAKLRDAITTDRAHEYSREHARDFDWISLAQFSSRSHAAAEEIAVAIRHGHGFYEMAETALRQGRCAQQSYFRRIPRHALVMELRPLIDAAEVGSVVGPVPEAEVYLLVKLVAVESVGVEYAMTAAKRKLFDEWLAERRSAARIEWFWGSARRTAPA